jgi:immunity protein 35 of polymorphic toxin system
VDRRIPVVITKARAVELVEAQLALIRQALTGYPEIAVSDVEQHALGWLVFWQSAEYLRSGDWEKQLVGQGPYLVDAQDGSIYSIPVTTFMSENWEQLYLEEFKGIKPPDPLLTSVREITLRDGALAGLRYLRRQTSTLSLLEARAYIDAVRDGGEPPEELTLRIHPRPGRAALAIEAVTGPASKLRPGR